MFAISVDLSAYNRAIANMRAEIIQAATEMGEALGKAIKIGAKHVTELHDRYMETDAWYRRLVERESDPIVIRRKAKALARSIRNNEARRTKLVRSRRKKYARLYWKRLRERQRYETVYSLLPPPPTRTR